MRSQPGYDHRNCSMDPKIVYICMCNALTDKQITQAIAANGLQRLSDVYAACGSRAQCGQCAHAMLRLARDHVCRHEQAIQAAA